ncbi:MAG TPA: hypothetical protein VMV18_12095 [bacterium]|nr:hypothetical protein [bacterium]
MAPAARVEPLPRPASDAERMYRRLGWEYVSVIPEFAMDPDRSTWHDAVIYYKRLTADAR